MVMLPKTVNEKLHVDEQGDLACGCLLVIDEASLSIAWDEKNGFNGNALFRFEKQ